MHKIFKDTILVPFRTDLSTAEPFSCAHTRFLRHQTCVWFDSVGFLIVESTILQLSTYLPSLVSFPH